MRPQLRLGLVPLLRMPPRVIEGKDELTKLIGQEFEVSGWIDVTPRSVGLAIACNSATSLVFFVAHY